jgi:Spy/CpxP family protein refolding chaperone
MRKDWFFKFAAVIAGFLSVAPLLLGIRAQSVPPSAAQIPGQPSPTMRPTRAANPMDDFTGLDFTSDQQAQIRHIRDDIGARRDAVIKDQKLDEDQRAAMLQGYQRIEYREIYELLTPDQRVEVRKKVQSRRAMEQREQQHQSPPK